MLSYQSRPTARNPSRVFYTSIQQNSLWCKNNKRCDDDGWIAKFLRSMICTSTVLRTLRVLPDLIFIITVGGGYCIISLIQVMQRNRGKTE